MKYRLILDSRSYDEERALYGSDGVYIRKSTFEGPADGESAFKESRNIRAEECVFRLRYPFWHDNTVEIAGCEMTDTCRAALWYTVNADITDTKLHGTKAVRECSDIRMRGCDIISQEFGWFSHNISITDSAAEGEYFMMRSTGLEFENVELKGKYSFQYVENTVFENCRFDTKDSLWHAKNVVVRNSTVKGEYLAWYCENVTFENCIISGTQPFCYCSGLKLINCEMHGADLAFEKSEVEADITTPVISIKNPSSGYINVPSAGEIIMTDRNAKCAINTGK